MSEQIMTFTNSPLEEIGRSSTVAPPCILVIFGATGDLTNRYLFPALYNLGIEGLLPTSFACIGFARREKSHEQLRFEISESIKTFSRAKNIESSFWKHFQEQFFYHQAAFDDSQGYITLNKFLQELDKKLGTKCNRIFYLATPPKHFPIIVEKLSQNGLCNKEEPTLSRVIIEKPFGFDLSSAQNLQSHLLQFLDEKQIFRIDHYLGKETVQNLLVFRFANAIFESIWNYKHIDHVQITVAEALGVGTRGHFFEEAGQLRDMLQNHVMQLLSLVAMEPPVSLEAEDVHNEKVKVLQSIRPLTRTDIDHFCTRGQYEDGYVNGEKVNGYRQEKDVSQTSKVESFVALKLFLDNWRWAGVPFYLRTGKRLPKRATEIAIIFKKAPGFLFPCEKGDEANVLSMNIQPDEGIAFKINCKVPGQSSALQPVKMDFRYSSYFGQTPPDAYERLIYDAILGDSTLFARQDEVLTSWEILTPILEHWKAHRGKFPTYAAGSWGPKEAEDMLLKEGRRWRYI